MKLTLNVGCGERTYTEYPPGHKCINYDERNLKVVDEVGNVKDLSRFPDEHFDYILASDIIEHFPIAETPAVLKEWRRVLKTGGIIEFRLPNLEAICKAYVSGSRDAKMTSWLLYGAQDYPGNFHYTAYDKKFLTTTLELARLFPFEYKEEGNNFIMKARKK